MLSTVRTWIIGITCCGVITAICQTLTPKGPVRKVVKLVCGFVMVIAMITPIVNLDFGKLSEYRIEYENTAEKYAADLKETNSRLARAIIEEQSAAYILSKAEDLDAEISAEVTARLGDEGLWYPYDVIISGKFTDEEQEKMSVSIESELAIPKERQQWKYEVKDG